jgi:BirA family transcriptional regulator, biotin operon repressor / biotin---[acetyl-CoA-carboxylase] ligase
MHENIDFIHFTTLDSTQTWAKRHAESLDPHRITCVTAEHQTAGVGQFKRRWFSPKGGNIHATFYFTLPKDSLLLTHLAQLMSLSCAKVLRAKGFQPEMKWPNDLLLAKKKVAGILCELLSLQDDWGILLGIGINLNMSEEHLQQIDQPATSLAQNSGRTWKVEEILPPLIDQFFDRDLPQFKSEGVASFLKEYETFH